MAKHKMRAMTKREAREFFGILLMMIEGCIAGVQGIAWVFFGMMSVEAFLFATVILAPLLAWLWLRSMDNQIETDDIDETNEAGA